jgi:ABC-type glycerol-3-phosphate transport system substrate-binding protein
MGLRLVREPYLIYCSYVIMNAVGFAIQSCTVHTAERSLMRLSVLFYLLCIVVLLGSGLAGCANIQPTPTPEPVTIRYACVDADNPRYASLIDEFRQLYPHITVDIVGGRMDIADVIMMPLMFMTEEIQNRRVIALDPYIEGDPRFAPDGFLPGTIEMLRDEGRLWGLPAGIDPLAMYYNQDLFDAAGVSYPEPRWTWDDFLFTASALTDPLADVYGYAPANDGLDVIAFLYAQGGGFMDSLTNPTRPTFDNPRNAEALTRWLDIAETHRVTLTPEEMSLRGISPQQMVYTDMAGMWISWFSDRGGSAGSGFGNWPTPWQMPWGVAPVPRGSTSTTIAMVSAYVISAQSAHPDAAWQWIAFLSERAAHEAAPARIEVLASEEYERLVGVDVADTVRGILEDAQLISPRIVAYMSAFEMFGRQIEMALRGTITIDEALEATQKEAERVGP